MAREKINYTHGSTGTQPSDGIDFGSSSYESPDSAHFDWFWNTAPTRIDNLIDEFTELDNDDDGVVDEADSASDSEQLDGYNPSKISSDMESVQFDVSYGAYFDSAANAIPIGARLTVGSATSVKIVFDYFDGHSTTFRTVSSDRPFTVSEIDPRHSTLDQVTLDLETSTGNATLTVHTIYDGTVGYTIR